ncbi:hypothetical protein Van01_55090 [Micromonospora andamanensis]|uniref:D-alanine--D-alanine ligase N-terminal domain-containing protein n=1 Tax=Micromonospora andamanensis TaxID=1287068 RepID=A0ABQ4I315_9ACTN|nr:hypothetical protein Van01_55090 [Micromonospora andamanensis]
MTRTIRVAVLYGGLGVEHDISRSPGLAVLGHLDQARFETVPMYVTRDGGRTVGRRPLDPAFVLGALRTCDVAFPLLHGRYGGDGGTQALLELVGLPYVGSPVLASAVAMDKDVTRRLPAAEGLTVPAGAVITGSATGRGAVSGFRQTQPVGLEPRRLAGDRPVRPRSGDRTGPPLRRQGAPRPARGRTRDRRGGAGTAGRARRGRSAAGDTGRDLPPESVRRLKDQAARVFRALGCRSQARVDFFLPGDGVPVVNG